MFSIVYIYPCNKHSCNTWRCLHFLLCPILPHACLLHLPPGTFLRKQAAVQARLLPSVGEEWSWCTLAPGPPPLD